MKIAVYSDLHFEFGDASLDYSNADLVILAGDIGVGPKSAEIINKKFSGVPVIYVLGNHEFYGQKFPDFLNESKALFANSNVTILENESVVIKDVEVFGCTLWTDFYLYNEPEICMKQAKATMSDYMAIHNSKTKRRLKPSETQNYHIKSVNG